MAQCLPRCPEDGPERSSYAMMPSSRNLRWASVVLSIAFAGHAVALGQQALPPPPRPESFLQIDGTGVDGTLHLGFDLGVLDVGGIPIAFRLAHRLQVDSAQNASSCFEVPELSSFLVPVGRDQIRVKLFGAGEIRFRAAEIDFTYRELGPPGVWIRRLDDDRYSIRMSNGWHWFFANGLLVSAIAPGEIELSFKTRGGLVTEMLAERGGDEVARLAANYSATGQLSTLDFGRNHHVFELSSDGTQVVVWRGRTATEAHRTVFSYTGGLLASINRDQEPTQNFAWEPVPDVKQYRSQWPLPVRIVQNPRFTLKYSLSQKGYRLDATSVRRVFVRSVCWNPALGTIGLLEDGRVIRRVQYGVRVGRADYRCVSLIEESGGEALHYEYGATGRVVRSWRGEGSPGY